MKKDYSADLIKFFAPFFLIGALSVVFSNDVFSQNTSVTFQRYLNTNFTQGTRADITSDNGFIVAGGIITTGSWNCMLMKTDFAGNIQFAKQLQSASVTSTFLDAIQTSDGNYAAVGYVLAAGNTDVIIAKYDSCGTLLWLQQYGSPFNEAVNNILQTADGGFVVTGRTATGTANADRNIMLLKVAADGTFEWVQSFGNAVFAEVGLEVIQTRDLGYALACKNLAGTGRAVLIKTDGLGVTQWSYEYEIGDGDGKASSARSLKELKNGGIALFYSGATSTGSGSAYKFGYLKIDAAGNVPSYKMYSIDTFDGQKTAIDYGIITKDGGFALAGHTNSRTLGGTRELMIIKTDSNGTVEWGKTYGFPGNSQCQGAGINAETAGKLRQTADTGYVFGGQTGNFTSIINLYLVKTDKSGRSGCNYYDIPVTQKTAIVKRVNFNNVIPQTFTNSASSLTSSDISGAILSSYTLACGTVYTPVDSIVSSGIYGPANFCTPTELAYSVMSLPGYTYSWSIAGAGAAITSGNGSSSVNVRFTTSGNYNLALTLTNSCGKQTQLSLQITVPVCVCPTVPAPTFINNESYCAGDLVPALTVNVPSGQTVDWYNQSSGGTLLFSGLPFVPTGPGTFYAVARVISSGCTSDQRTAVDLVQNPSPITTSIYHN